MRERETRRVETLLSGAVDLASNATIPYDPQPLSNSCDLVLPCHRRVLRPIFCWLSLHYPAAVRVPGVARVPQQQAAPVSSGGTGRCVGGRPLCFGTGGENHGGGYGFDRGRPTVRPVGRGNRGALREAIGTPQRRDPQAYEALKEILTQHNAEMPAPMARLVREQCLAIAGPEC